MAKGYWVVSYREDDDAEALKAYGELVGAATGAFGAKRLVRGIPAKATEAGLQKRTVVVEFESLEKALACYHSEAYQAAKAKLSPAIVRDFRIVEGAE